MPKFGLFDDEMCDVSNEYQAHSDASATATESVTAETNDTTTTREVDYFLGGPDDTFVTFKVEAEEATPSSTVIPGELSEEELYVGLSERDREAVKASLEAQDNAATTSDSDFSDNDSNDDSDDDYSVSVSHSNAAPSHLPRKTGPGLLQRINNNLNWCLGRPIVDPTAANTAENDEQDTVTAPTEKPVAPIDAVKAKPFAEAFLEEPLPNLAVAVPVTSFTVTTFKQPTVAMAKSLAKFHSFLPPVAEGVAGQTGFAGVMKRLYRGYGSNIMPDQAKGVASVTANMTKPDQEPRRKGIIATYFTSQLIASNIETAHTLFFGQVDALFGQFSNKGALESVSKEGTKLPWRGNTVQFVQMAYPLKAGSSVISIYALCGLTDKFQSRIDTGNPVADRALAGAMAGGVSAVFNTPLSMAADAIVTRSEIANGKVIRMTHRQAVQALRAHIQDKGLSFVVKQEGLRFAKSVPVNVTRTMIIFGTIQGMTQVLGDRPLKHIVDEAKHVRQSGLGFFKHASAETKAIQSQPQNPKNLKDAGEAPRVVELEDGDERAMTNSRPQL